MIALGCLRLPLAYAIFSHGLHYNLIVNANRVSSRKRSEAVHRAETHVLSHYSGQRETPNELRQLLLALNSLAGVGQVNFEPGRSFGHVGTGARVERLSVDMIDSTSEPGRIIENTKTDQDTHNDQSEVAPEPIGLAVGIDLGTTTSTIAVVIDGMPRVVHTVKSTVRPYHDSDSNLMAKVGEKRSEDVLFSAKRLIGRSYSEVERALPRHSPLYKILKPLPNSTFAGLWHAQVKQVISPEWVGSKVIEDLLDASEAVLGVRAEKAVIGVPANFDESQREATRRAAENAGLSKVQLISEPVAAALAYDIGCASNRGVQDETVCVMDLGGGTLDVSIVLVGGFTAEVLGSNGNAWLGGDDFDAAIAKHLVSEAGFTRKSESSPEVVIAARRAKERLTFHKNVSVLLREAGSGKTVEVGLRREVFKKKCKDLVKKLQEPLLNVCMLCGFQTSVQAFATKNPGKGRKHSKARPSLQGKQLDRVLLVGAASRMPIVSEVIDDTLGITADKRSISPEFAVALGAAMQAGMLQGELEQFEVFTPVQAALQRAEAEQVIASRMGLGRDGKLSQKERKMLNERYR